MKRSEINQAFRRARDCFQKHSWALPPNARWDITDFGLGDFSRQGLTLVNLANEPEYCEKLMYAWQGQQTPCHTHSRKKEDIICRAGSLLLRVWARKPENDAWFGDYPVPVLLNGVPANLAAGRPHVLEAGHRVTLVPGIWHAFVPASDECIIGEVSTANDDLRDNFFLDPSIGRFPLIEEDQPAQIRLVSESE